MRILASVLALAMVIAVPSLGDAAQKKKKKARQAAVTQQGYQGYPSFSVPGSRTRAGTPCVAYTWRGCEGWDPDPNVRMMIDMDRGKDER